jgi:hypothetical protein
MSVLTDFSGLVRPVFIETGTGFGDTLAKALELPFISVHSIECSPEIYRAAVARFGRRPRAHVWYGDSREVLPLIIDNTVATTFWLDAHWSGGTYGESRPPVECALLGELAAIFAVSWVAKPIILVDDCEAFDPGFFRKPLLGPIGALAGFRPSEWPAMADVLRSVPPGYSATRIGNILRVE